MTPIERAELLTELYALRSQAGALHRRSSVFGLGSVAVAVAIAMENITESINTLQNLNHATTTEPDSSITSPVKNSGTDRNALPQRSGQGL